MFDAECGCVFHAGFKEVADVVVDDLERFLEPGAEVKVAGHSLGGAAAVIVAAKLKLRGHNVGKVRLREYDCCSIQPCSPEKGVEASARA